MVIIEPVIEFITIPVPSTAASKKFLSLFDLKQLSSTTMDASTIIPIPSTNEPMDIRFSEKPAARISVRATITDIGIELPTISEALISPKNINKTIIESITAIISVLNTSLIDSLIYFELSNIVVMVKSLLFAFSSSITLLTCFDTSTEVDDCCFVIANETTSSPL